MVLVHDAGPEYSFAMGLELGSKKVDILRKVRFPEARGGTMKKHTPSSLACEIKERLSLSLDIQFIQVGKDQEHVVLSEVFFGESLDGIRVGDIDSLGPQGLPEDTEASRRVMIKEVFTPQEEHLNTWRGLSLLLLPVRDRDEGLNYESCA
tara:strand:- start:2197 stop:2649 length:453 start_codon:yes stop_codon:yes gene_type:complete